MAREIRLNAFQMNTPGHSWPGLWRHPRDRSDGFARLDFWTDLARLAERGLLDGIFIADTFGLHDVYLGGADAALAAGAQVPIHDPALVISAMAAVTRHLGFGLTTSVAYEHPYILARRFSTLDHLTNGRIGWNIVTGFLDSAARAMGEAGALDHDERYARAEDYLALVYKLWEESWEDGAVLRDKARGIYADPAKVHAIRHDGPYFRSEAVHLCEPSPQRTPVLYQAGTSPAGKRFAARHAECVFINGHTRSSVARTVSDLRRQATEAGRDPSDLKVFLGATVIAAASEAEARDLVEEYRPYVDPAGILALMSGRLGVDLGAVGLDEPLTGIESNGVRSIVEALTRTDPNRTWTPRDLTRFAGAAGRGPFIVGSAVQVADELQDWADETDIDGFNLTRIVFPETLEAVVDLVVPELQSRGAFKTSYRDGPFREKLFGHARGRLPASHPAKRGF
ncbi:FMN-dependent monooxygenase [Bosea caraganae]|uniref:FMN-dependent monooxygenase n=1 Tax=Bosea caraganae TaxID=2763117 RepID=A0A370L2X9_9HYPH|nr:LLM class flavin-dependent oxidoreductase [Bosea caraganae]RDJ22430.1 FMN-dependent monooxygenase [Bosea caraganae]RDJ30389.1 FMN-dependent monooxygenase [Bosea caraganae]